MIPLRKNEQGSLIWIERQSKFSIENEKEWKQHCLRLHLQFGHGSYSKLETMLLKALKGDTTFDKYRKERLIILKRICEECRVCVKYGWTPSRPSVGLPLAEDFNKVVTIDLGELGDKFLVMVDWATRYCQAIWVNSKRYCIENV